LHVILNGRATTTLTSNERHNLASVWLTQRLDLTGKKLLGKFWIFHNELRDCYLASTLSRFRRPIVGLSTRRARISPRPAPRRICDGL